MPDFQAHIWKQFLYLTIFDSQVLALAHRHPWQHMLSSEAHTMQLCTCISLPTPLGSTVYTAQSTPLAPVHTPGSTVYTAQSIPLTPNLHYWLRLRTPGSTVYTDSLHHCHRSHTLTSTVYASTVHLWHHILCSGTHTLVYWHMTPHFMAGYMLIVSAYHDHVPQFMFPGAYLRKVTFRNAPWWARGCWGPILSWSETRTE